jgi:hypothetical protein
MANWLDLEMGADLTGWMEFGDQKNKHKRMTMSQGEQLSLLPAPKTEGPLDPKEEKVLATCSEKTEG